MTDRIVLNENGMGRYGYEYGIISVNVVPENDGYYSCSRNNCLYFDGDWWDCKLMRLLSLRLIEKDEGEEPEIDDEGYIIEPEEIDHFEGFDKRLMCPLGHNKIR